MSLFDKIFGTHSEREIKRINSLVDKIEELRPGMQKLSTHPAMQTRMASCPAATTFLTIPITLLL